MKLVKLLANLKYGSRKDIKKALSKNLVSVNGEIVTNFNLDILESDKIKYNDEEVFHKNYIYLILNKPSGYLSTTKGESSVIDLIDYPYKRYNLSICGRLDKDTEGMLILTNDGDMVHKIISPKKKVYKKYYVKLAKKLQNYEKLLTGVYLLDGKNQQYKTKECKIEPLTENSCYISILEGKFHQVKRMFLAIDNEVVYLKRIEIGNLKLKELAIGKFKEITKEEIIKNM